VTVEKYNHEVYAVEVEEQKGRALGAGHHPRPEPRFTKILPSGDARAATSAHEEFTAATSTDGAAIPASPKIDSMFVE
jgi:hypothetical protein